MAGDELEFVKWLRSHAGSHPSLRLGIGDDMAVLGLSGGTFLLSSDMLLDGVHFDSKTQELPRIGRKAIACSLSDCAAMAVRPIAVTISVAMPFDFELGRAKELFGGMMATAREFELAVAGGDTTRWAHPLAIDVAITAEPYPGVEPVARSSARVGDLLCVTGPLGGSLLGHHLDFTPRVRESRKLAESLGERLHAMIDISDGLSLDLWRMCQESKVGAVLESSQLETVISDSARQLSLRDGVSALDHALGDGEDFELLLAVRGEFRDSPVPLYPIGTVVESALSLRQADGRLVPIAPKGFVH